MPEHGLSKSPKALPRPLAILPLPPQEENLPEMGGNLGPCPRPCPPGPAASPQNECCLCALSCLRGLPSNHFFPGGTAKGSLGAGAGVAKLPGPPRPVEGGGAGRGARGARCHRMLLPPPPARRGWSLAPHPAPSRLAAAEGEGHGPGRGPDQAEGSPWPAPPSA